ncbi:tetratricopeptide repeat protein, partial [Lacinutrix sp.]|uniref:tetratricopeptide repeat protein n=1 Tax=Lacinutrix sp. TaxID=1937692 RepID=UPI0025C08954
FLYLGVSQLELENYTEALKNFQKIIDSKTMDQSKGYWYKALTYLKMDDRENAIKEFEISAYSPKHFNHVEARELLKELKK